MKFKVITPCLLGAVSLALSGCGGDKPAETTTNTPASTPKALQTPSPNGTDAGKMPLNTAPGQPGGDSPMAGGGATPGTTPPMMGGGGAGTKMTAEEALASVPKSEPKYAAMQKKQDEAEAALKAKARDAATKKAYVEQTYAYARDVMSGDNSLPSTTKYRAALALYRRVLKVDPTHAPTLADKKTIDDIYNEMHRPSPQ